MQRLVVIALFLSLPAAALAQDNATAGSLAPSNGGAPLSITSQEVEVRIANGIAVTTVTQVFHNASSQQMEAVYSFPVPKDASLSSFSMWIGGKEIIGEVLEKAKARQIYESITRTRRDPGLLEQNSHKLFQARVFPVQPDSDQRIQIAYYQPVDYDSGFCTYTYPLRCKTKEFSAVTGTLSIDVEVDSATEVTTARSPSHGERVVIHRRGPNRVLASYEHRQGVLTQDFVLMYQLKEERTGVSLVPFADGKEDGYYMITLTPGEQLKKLDRPANYVVVVDISGSMEGAKISTANDAVRAILNELSKEDTFQIVTFNVGAVSWPEKAVAVTDESRADADRFLSKLRPAGGTDILEGLRRAASHLDAERPNVVVLLSDGVSDSGDEAARQARRLFPASQARVFALGVGNEINRGLLSQLARDTGGWTDFMSTAGDVQHHAKLLARKIVHQSIGDVVVTVEGLETYEQHPRELPHLFSGSQITVFGRYKGKGEASVVVSGTLMGRRLSIPIKTFFPESDADYPEIRRAWALKAVEDEIEAINNGTGKEAALARVIALGTQHSIVTPYTSMLVLESEAQYGQFGIDRRNRDRVLQERQAQQGRTKRDRFVSNNRPSFPGGGGGSGGSVGLGLLGLAAGAALLARRRKKAA